MRYADEEGRKVVRLSVFNSGSYIPEEKRNDIFRRFYHIDGNTNNSGIGLALAKALTLTHKGAHRGGERKSCRDDLHHSTSDGS